MAPNNSQKSGKSASSQSENNFDLPESIKKNLKKVFKDYNPIYEQKCVIFHDTTKKKDILSCVPNPSFHIVAHIAAKCSANEILAKIVEYFENHKDDAEKLSKNFCSIIQSPDICNLKTGSQNLCFPKDERDNIYREYITQLYDNKNLILTGAPGTGKTYIAKKMAALVVSGGLTNEIEELKEEEQKQVGFVQFHPSYDYTDFVEGLRPDGNGGFRRQDGIFKSFCKSALEHEGPCVFVIDEINRGELSKIFGELFYSIEPSNRGEKGRVKTQYQEMVKVEHEMVKVGQEKEKVEQEKEKVEQEKEKIEKEDPFCNGFYVPENVYVIGTMNDVDRGVEAMDFAIRRRFAWMEVTVKESAEAMGITDPALTRMKNLNAALMNEKIGGLSDEYCIGGAYFRQVKDFNSLWEHHLKGVIAEYFRGDPDIEDKMKKIKDAYDLKKKPKSQTTAKKKNVKSRP